jgi:predicted RNase H-like HicB family nuclease/DNA-binding XRE family transcriptional regulator
MRFAGRLIRDGRWWLAEIPLLDALTQGRTRRDALDMVKDWIETAVNRSDFHVTVHEKGRTEFEVSGSDATSMIALLLRRRRAASGASLRDMANKLGATSRNAYARYERGEAVPTLEKLDTLLKATSPGGDFVIRETQ